LVKITRLGGDNFIVLAAHSRREAALVNSRFEVCINREKIVTNQVDAAGFPGWHGNC